MPARDYKNKTGNNTGRARKSSRAPGSWISFISGLGVGLLVAFGVYLWSGYLRLPGNAPAQPPAAVPREEPASEMSAELPRPTFDFYKILPEMEVPIPDWQPDEGHDETSDITPEQSAAAADEAEVAPLDQGTYLLQVGSFKAFEDADRVKATLALHGIAASIQRVVINGQDVWYRVHIGPLSNEEEIRTMRVRLVENNMDSILLRIGDTTGSDAQP